MGLNGITIGTGSSLLRPFVLIFFYQGLSGADGQGDNYDVDTGSMLCPVFFAHVLSIRIPILLRSSSSPGSSPR